MARPADHPSGGSPRPRRRAGKIVFLLAVCQILFGLEAEAKVRISTQGDCWGPRMAVDGQGNIHVVWLQAYGPTSGDIFYTRCPAATGQWRTPVNLSNSGAAACDTFQACALGLDASGRLYAAWGEIGSGIKLRTLTGESWSGVEHVASTARPEQPRIAVDGPGNLFLVWFTHDGGEVYSRARVGGAWESVRTISQRSFRSKFPDIAVNNGVVYAVFTESTYDYQVVYCHRGTGLNAGWSTPAPVFTEFPLAHHHPSVAVDGGGVPHIAWSRVLPDDSATQVLYSGGTGGGFSAPVEMSDWTGTHWPAVVQRNNTVYVLWQEGSWEGGTLHSRLGRGREWSDMNLVPHSDGAVYMDFGFDPQGRMNFVWNGAGQVYFERTGDSVVVPPRINQPPVARFSHSPSGGFAPVEIQFDGFGSTDPDGRIVHWDWLFSDGGTASGGVVFHTFEQRGVYQVKLTVVDNDGQAASEVRSIEILGIFPPLDIRWRTVVDESMFLSRYVTEVSWEANPANEAYGIVRYNVYRREAGTANPWKAVGHTAGDVFRFLDTNVKKKDAYVYTVAAVDGQGHESRPSASPAEGSSSVLEAEGSARRLPSRGPIR